jgi:hypothetical protein
MSKVTFDGLTKLITVNAGVTTIDVAIDVYSAWKQWVLVNPGWDAAFRTVGGDYIGPNQKIPTYFFLINNWKVVVDNLNVNFSYNLYSDDYVNPIQITNSSVYVNNSNVPYVEGLSSITYDLGVITTQLSAITTDMVNIVIELNDVILTLTGMTGTIEDIARNVISILGLSQHNYRLTNQIYDADNRLLTCDIKLYNNATDCVNDVNAFEEYEMTASYDANGNLNDYKVILL